MKQVASDVIIVGGGLMGSSTAFFLRQQGVSVTLIERDRVGQHASGTNFGNVRRQGRPLWQLELAGRSSEIWRQANELLGTDIEYIQSGHMRLCYKNQANAADKLELYAQEAKQHGLSLEMFTGEALRKKFPFLGPDVLAASHSELDGHANSRLVSPAFARAAVRLGANIFENTRVLAVEKAGEDFLVNCEDGSQFRAPTLVLCTGAWANELCSQFGESVPITSFGPTMSVTEPTRYFIKPSVGVYTSVEKESIYFRQIPRGNVIIGGSTRNIGKPAVGHTSVRAGNIVSQMEQVRRLAPPLERLNIIRTWTGTEGYMPDGHPVLGPSARTPGLYYAFAFSGAGFQIGPGVGQTLAELITTGSSAIDLSPYSVDRFSTTGNS